MLTHTPKRKKRKTRKCLDELRKRSRYNMNVFNTNQYNHNGNKLDSDSSYIRSISNCITSDRLTLAIFPKAIRSETIKRPTINEKDIKEYSLNRINNERKESLNIINDKISSEENKSAFEECSDLEEISLNNENDHVKSNSLDLINPESLTAGISVLEDSPNSEIFPVAQDYRDLYKEFTNKIPPDLRKIAPGLFKNEVSKSNQLLQNMEDFKREYKENILKCENNNYSINRKFPTNNNNSNESIIQNPMDFIRIGYADEWQQNSMRVDNNSETFNSSFTVHSSTASSSTSIQMGIHDTPEYVYYPHKLN